MVLLDKGLHYLRVKGLTALPLIPGVRASVPHLQIGNTLFLAAPRFPFRLVQELKLSLSMYSEAVPGLGSVSSTVIVCIFGGL